jgi:HD-GYP domain-containing protein (c-di-GMP phosphodiesterase class II)
MGRLINIRSSGFQSIAAMESADNYQCDNPENGLRKLTRWSTTGGETVQRPENSQPDTTSPGRPDLVPELTAQIHGQRQPVSDSQREILAGEYAILQREFAELIEESRPLLCDERLTEGAPQLAQTAILSSAIARLIAGELNRIDDKSADLVSPAIACELIERYGEQLALLELRRLQIDACNVYASDLHQTVQELLFETHIAPAQLQNLARRIRLDVQHASIAELLPESGLMIKNQLTPIEWQSEPSVYAIGIQTARLLAFAAPRMFSWNDRTELLVVAALLQDIGLLLLERQHDQPANQLAIDNPAAYRQHPPIGAALTAALTDYAVDLPSLIAQHHERCDGIGYPHGERSDRMAAPSRFLAIAVRFVELMQNETLRGSIVGEESGRNTLYTTIARRLLREAEQGELDQPLTFAFLQQFGLSDVETRTTARFFKLGRFSGKRFRRDDAVSPSSGRRIPSDADAKLRDSAPAGPPHHRRRTLIDQPDRISSPD